MIPKFRVFAKAGVKSVFGGGYDTDQMFYEIRDIDFYDKEVTVWGCHNKDCGLCDDTYKIEDVEIMMSTGLKDKDGVDIYEGDIVVNHVGDEWVITNFRGAFRYYPIESFSKEKEIWFETDNIGNFGTEAFEIIGNIWEDPERLEVAE